MLLSLLSGDGDVNGLPKGGLYCVSNQVFSKRCVYRSKKEKTKVNDQNKLQIKQILSLWGCQLRRFLDVNLSIFRWNEGIQWQSDRFSWPAIWMSLMMSSGAHMAHTASATQIAEALAVVGISQVCVMSFSCSLQWQGSEKKFCS